MSDLFKIVTKDLILNWLIITLIFALHCFCAEIYDNYSEANFSIRIRIAFSRSLFIFFCLFFYFILGPNCNVVSNVFVNFGVDQIKCNPTSQIDNSIVNSSKS